MSKNELDVSSLFAESTMGAPVEEDGRRAMHKPSRYDFVRKVLESPGEDNYLARLSPEQQERIAVSHRQLRSGASVNGPLWCFGPAKCPFHALCPLAVITDTGEVVASPVSDYPLGRPCILEDQYYRHIVIGYMESLNVSHNDPVEMSQVKDLALIDLQKQRCLNILSVGDKNGEGRDMMLHTETVIPVPKGTVTNTVSSLHPLNDMIDRLEARRQKILTKLLATRKDRVDAQAKLNQKEEAPELNNVILELREYFQNARTKRLEPSSERLIALDSDDA